jgi:signal peptidase I
MSRARTIVVHVADVALWITATIGAAAAVASVVLLLHGTRPLVVTSGSMEPAYPVRSLALVSRVDAGRIHEGDVVAVSLPSGRRVLHRVAAVHVAANGQRAVTLKGDANPKPDVEPVVLDRRAYRAVACVPFVGTIAMWFRTPAAGFLLALVLLGPLALRRRTTTAPSLPGGAPQAA